MPDPVLHKLSELLQKVKRDLAMPVQVHLNLMASIGKKTGGSRTVAVAATLYRLLMELDDEKLKQFETKEAFSNDTAKAGANASHSAEDRALQAELMTAEGKALCSILWDFKKFFDMIDTEVLIEEAAAVGFPMEELILSLTVHQAPRRLKTGKVVGEAMEALGRAILAGCKRSTQLARAYSLRMVRKLAAAHPRVDLYQHVDDMTVFIKPQANHLLAEEAIDYIIDFAHEA